MSWRAVGALVFLAACWDPPSYEGKSCDSEGKCPLGFACTEQQICSAVIGPADDAGNLPPDGGGVIEDGGPADAEPIDGGACGSAIACGDDPACDDGNACTEEHCDLMIGCCTSTFAGAGTPCADDLDACTADACDDSGGCLHVAGNAGLVCRESIDECDVEESCTGDAVCSSDQFRGEGSDCSLGSCIQGFCLPEERTGLVAYWKLDELGGSTIYDAVRGGRDGIAAGDPSRIAGQLGGALHFDRLNDSVQIEDLEYGPSFTISLWFRLSFSSLGVYQVLYSHGEVGELNRIEIYIHPTGRILTQVSDANGLAVYLSSRNAVADDAWHLATFAYAAGEGGRIYVDGSIAARDNTVVGDVEPETPIWFGSRTDGAASHRFSGDLDDVRVFDRRLTAAEAIALYRASNGAPPVFVVPEADTYVRGGTNSAISFGTLTELVVKNDADPEFNRDSFLRFDLTGIPPVATASLSMTLIGRGPLAVINNVIGFVEDDAWDETTTNFLNAPATARDIAAFAAPPVAGSITVDATSDVQSAQGTDQKVSFSLKSPIDQGGDASAWYGSRENLDPPKLYLYW